MRAIRARVLLAEGPNLTATVSGVGRDAHWLQPRQRQHVNALYTALMARLKAKPLQ